MIKISSLSLQRGGNFLLEGADATVHPGQRVAIVGANGAGKSSLFMLILGKLTQDAGELQLPGNWRIAHMAQEVSETHRNCVDYVVDGDYALRTIERELQEAEALEDHTRMALLHAQIDKIDGYNAKVRAEQLLHGLGFKQSDLQRPVKDFSGGWRIRLNLAQALMCPSDLLMLDEPTNHLDLDATLWLEQWLKRYPGTILFISHDRDFIDNVATHVLHFEHKKLSLYTGTYSDFEVMRAERLAQQQASFEQQQRKIAHIEDFIRRFKAKASKARQAQSRVKELERMEKIAPAHIDSPFSFEFLLAAKMSDPLLNMSAAMLGYLADKPIVNEVKLSIHPGTRLGLLGPNGAGKSTLIKSLVGDLPLLSGARTTGEHLKIGYFAQHQLEALDLNASPLLHLQRLEPTATEQSIRNFLGSFGFFGDDALGDIKRFSGGEKARLALAIIAWQRPNLLLLDEPTNHLDLEMRHALTMALQDFEGAVVVVSHDRHMLKNTVDEFILVAEGRAATFDGDLHDYERWLIDYQRRQAQRPAEPASDALSQGGESAEARKERKKREAENRQRLSPLKKSIARLETSMEKLQLQLADFEGQLADPALYEAASKARLKSLMDEQTHLKRQLEDTEADWLAQNEELEMLEASLAAQ
ncbi:MAG: ATP-binding cassette domain-containing protein [Hahellaceae bacterium]|nr:ATP-binding cassette domain-containing protein [Hahellaceae bacterium]MCP5168171.1 ATP-binding cassette domain-containing protein [Hahellaceae bacterium]